MSTNTANPITGVEEDGSLRVPSALSVGGGRAPWLMLHLADTCELVAGLVVAWFWLRSALAHVTNSHYFLSSIYSYEIVGPRLGIALAIALPALQLVLAAAFAVRRLVGGAWLLSAGLLIVFITAQFSAAARGLNISCGCFGPGERQPIGGESLATTSLLGACAIGGFAVWLFRQGPRKAG